MLSRIVLSAAATAAPSLKNAAFLGPGVLQTTRTFHTGQPHLAPVPPLPEYGGKVRHGLIPEEFFQYLYPKTGVTGPYVLGAGLILYALSKEIYVITGETVTGLVTIGIYIFGIKKFGPSVAAFADKLNEVRTINIISLQNNELWNTRIVESNKCSFKCINNIRFLILLQNNIALTMEVSYRQRLHMVYKEVKNRLDYHISVQNMMRRKEQEHMINWVEKHVVQSISAQQEKETIAKCIADLKLLAKKAQAQPVM
ncbi:ATP synthase F(0) complex subunit B1, mitochondrial [Cebus imitator]|uniref:ATP synthase F(0) complex subunit B1, mitochondrial n=1 Tax=Cebus imitator TaxID=2715852 RepID=UPI00189AA561|nr:ATP synthase F(0) complex subunit B1, mitochondrial [Cebus imitator]